MAARGEIRAGVCGFTTSVRASRVGEACRLSIESDCSYIREMAGRIGDVDPLCEVTYGGVGPATLRAAAECCPHPACPVPVGILKVVEIESGLALPTDVTISLYRD